MSMPNYISFLLLVLQWLSVVMGNSLHRYSLDENGSPVDSSTLRLVQALFRHGDRSPIHAYKNDLYSESDWPQGYGQLSTIGMLQEYHLGQYLKQMYVDSGFMGAPYSRQQISVRSTNYDRTLMSAYSVLAGLFPPIGDQVWNPGIPWQPIPVHTMPKEEDFLLHTDTNCPKYSEYVEKYKKNNSAMQKVVKDNWLLSTGNCPSYSEYTENYIRNNSFVEKTLKDNWDLYQYISKNAGEEPTWEGMSRVLDPIFCQYVSNKTMPEWVNKNDTLKRLFDLIDVYSTMGIPPAVAYLKGGMLVGEMIDHMKNKSETPDSQQKMYLYSAHDTTVNAFLRTLGIFNDRKPQYTACVIVELHEPTKGDYFVKILYKNETLYNETVSQRVPYILKLNACDSLCPLKTFHQIMKSSIPADIKKECGLESPTALPVGSKETTVAIIVLSSLVLLLIAVGGILCFLMKKNLRDSHQYSPVPMEMT